MPNKRDGASDKDSIYDFISETIGEDYRKVEEDLGNGYFRLCTSEADRRQAAQDIRSSEDILIELLRNSRDASAKNIFIATHRVGNTRTIVIIDDGSGIPESMHEKIFQPRVTSKLDTAHLDKWGMHGRGMALFSISSNALCAKVAFSREKLGTSLLVDTDLDTISEKTDQSTFPHFEVVDNTHSMRGPKNILRTAAEFAIEHDGELDMYCGSFTEIAATMWQFGIKTVPASLRAFSKNNDEITLPQSLSMASDAEQFVDKAVELGLDISKRSAMRIMNNEIKPLSTLVERIKAESFGTNENDSLETEKDANTKIAKQKKLKISREDLGQLCEATRAPFSLLAQKYYLADQSPHARQYENKIIIEFKIMEKD